MMPTGLSTAEQAAWNLALWGNTLGWGGNHDEPNCRDWARTTLEERNPHRLVESDEFAPLFEAIDQMRAGTLVEITDADRDWANCMADTGHLGFERQWEAEDRFRDEYSGAISNFFSSTQPQGAWIGSVPWRELREKEIVLALADLECRTATNFRSRNNAFKVEVETQFVEDNRAALEALRAAAEQLQ